MTRPEDAADLDFRDPTYYILRGLGYVALIGLAFSALMIWSPWS